MCLKIRRDTQVSFTRCSLHFSRVRITGVYTKLLVRVLGTKLRSLCLHGILPSDISLQVQDHVIYNEEKYIGSWFWSLGILRSCHWQLQKVFWLCHHMVDGERVRESKVGRKTNFIFLMVSVPSMSTGPSCLNYILKTPLLNTDMMLLNFNLGCRGDKYSNY